MQPRHVWNCAATHSFHSPSNATGDDSRFADCMPAGRQRDAGLSVCSWMIMVDDVHLGVSMTSTCVSRASTRTVTGVLTSPLGASPLRCTGPSASRNHSEKTNPALPLTAVEEGRRISKMSRCNSSTTVHIFGGRPCLPRSPSPSVCIVSGTEPRSPSATACILSEPFKIASPSVCIAKLEPRTQSFCVASIEHSPSPTTFYLVNESRGNLPSRRVCVRMS
ncbi:hypothetical protein HPB50_023882 [Hyalomma asiaticum]|uniref:Uncharacterized protein n=1 Tax=Hyalomma asiaticum TaxID=266040 RepID=A0ACB7RWU2_HYAAI|nr:hypothetical protein HPB50_023882 [Hyalomma asiaticum]